jgi:hypothetical protein
MISGAHLIFYSEDVEAERKFFRDVLRFPSEDAGHGWLIFALPLFEAAFHPSERNGPHELFSMCSDLQAEMEALAQKGVSRSQVETQGWGSITRIRLPGRGEVGHYQPTHPTALKSI